MEVTQEKQESEFTSQEANEQGSSLPDSQNEMEIVEEKPKPREDINTVALFAAGLASSGQLGAGTDENQLLPVPVKGLASIKIIQIAAGDQHTDAGEIFSWGRNEEGQLGRQGRTMVPQRINTLESVVVSYVACGGNHTIAVTALGELFSWGQNDSGQLGLGDKQIRTRPVLIKELKGKRIVKVACGTRHSIFLSDHGEVFACGRGGAGQLGLGDQEDRKWPVQINSLISQPIISAACGDSHTVLLTVSGTIFVFGANSFGQLGLAPSEMSSSTKESAGAFSSTVNTPLSTSPSSASVLSSSSSSSRGILTVPTVLKALQSQHVTQICCGPNFTACITAKGRLFTFGHGMFFQLGHGKAENESVPTLVESLKDYRCLRVSCGGRHTLVIRETRKSPEQLATILSMPYITRTSDASLTAEIVAFGNNGSGQLGVGHVRPIEHPTPVSLSTPASDISAGGLHSIFSRLPPSQIEFPLSILSEDSQPDVAFEHTRVFRPSPYVPPPHLSSLRTYAVEAQISSTSLSHLRAVIESDQAKGDKEYKGLISVFSSVFTSPGSMNASFLKSDNYMEADEYNSGLDLYAVREAHLKILSLSVPAVAASLFNSCSRLVSNLRMVTAQHAIITPEMLRVYLIVMENPFLESTNRQNVPVLEKLCSALLALPPYAMRIIKNWWARMPSEMLAQVVRIFQSMLSFALEMGIETQAAAACSILEQLHSVNEESNVLPHTAFYNASLTRTRDFREDYLQWRSNSMVFSFLKYPFLLDAAAKISILHIESQQQMQQRVTQSVVAAMQGYMFSPTLSLVVHRDRVAQDALSQISLHSPADLKKPLQIRFEGEEGVDEGGLTKEFFQLIEKNLFDPKFGMFILNEESRLFWFNPNSLEASDEFTLVGIILGMAIYNNRLTAFVDALLDVRFPRAIYKKLLGSATGLEDVKEVNPSVGHSLEKLLSYPGDVENDLSVNFSVTYEYFGERRTYELLPNGAQIPVTNDNRGEYVKRYVDYILNISIAKQFEAFKKGFMMVAGGPVLKLFRPEELELLISGSQVEPDFKELQNTARYEGFSKDHPVVTALWSVLNSLDLESKRRFLKFCTGSDRVPVKGVASVRLTIQRNGPDSDKLPTASTCYNVLLLPEYSSRAKLAEKLLKAIREGAEGFGLK